MIQVIVVVAVVLVGTIVAMVVQRRRPEPPSNPGSYVAPAQLDRADFVDPAKPWLVAVFTSSTCGTCGDVLAKAGILESSDVAVADVEVGVSPELHERYRIEAVPMCVIADVEGVVRRSFIGAVTSTHLWAALAELRDPGSVPEGCEGHG